LVVLLTLVGTTLSLRAQVLTAMELSDPTAQRLQQRHMKALLDIAAQIETRKLPYPFYFSRSLDLDLRQQIRTDQRSIHFDNYKGRTILEITGNYYAAYSADKVNVLDRVRDTYNAVILPILQASVPHFPDDSEFSAFGIEVSHHVRRKVLGASTENPENITVIIPVDVAQKLVDATTDEQRQACVLEAEVFLDGQPFSLWLGEGIPSAEWRERASTAAANNKPYANASPDASGASKERSPVSPSLVITTAPMHIFTQQELTNLQTQYQAQTQEIVQGLDKEAHFFAYAPPTFIGFRQGTYLQLSFSTSLSAAPEVSRYKQAALAFDEHVSHLVRPLLSYFPADPSFDGVDFSSVIRLADGSTTISVEFLFPFRMMRCFASYDCTGQQLLDSGTVVINGERAAVNLQVAEGKN
jgi:hypothetical protein